MKTSSAADTVAAFFELYNQKKQQRAAEMKEAPAREEDAAAADKTKRDNEERHHRFNELKAEYEKEHGKAPTGNAYTKLWELSIAAPIDDHDATTTRATRSTRRTASS